MAGRYDIIIDQGSTYTRDFIWQDEDGAPQNVTDYTARMMVRKTYNASGAPVYDSDPGGDLVVSDALGGKFTLTMSDEVTAALPAPFKGVYDIEIESPGGVVTRLVEGTISITPNVTRPDT